MLRIRRLYFFLVLYVSLSMVLTGVATLLRVVLERVLDVPSSGFFGLFIGRDQLQEQTALGTALVVIGAPVWLWHWRTVRGWVARSDGVADRASALRRLYIYGVLLTTGVVAYSAGRDFTDRVLALVLGQANSSVQLSGLTGTLPFALTAIVIWLGHWRIAAADRVAVGEDGPSATLRRWYLYVMLGLGIVPLMVNLAGLGQRVWEMLLEPNARQAGFAGISLARTLASNGATILTAVVVWFGHELWSQTMLRVGKWYGEDERRSVLRKVYLYAVVLVTATWALVNASEILRFGVASLLGVAPARIGDTPIVVALGAPLISTIVFGAFWALFWRALGREAVAQAEYGRQAAVRRLYFYLVSAIALAFLGWSVASLLRLGADTLIQASVIDPAALKGDLARNVSWLVIGLVVWVFHWSHSQSLTYGEAGIDEVRATTRRWYLYIVAFVGLAAVLFSGGRVIFEIVLMALGRSPDSALLGELSHALMDALVALVVLWYHWFLVLRADLAAIRQQASTQEAVAVIAGLDAESAQSLEQFVRESLSGARARVYWTDQAHARAAVEHALQEKEAG